MIAEVLRFALFVSLGLLSVITAAVLISVVRQGPMGLADLCRRGFGIRAWLDGAIPEQGHETSIDVIEGIEIKVSGTKILRARQTRGISAEY